MQDCCTSKNIVTNEYYKNSYTTPTNTNAGDKSPLGIHIDHIFVRSAESVDIAIKHYGLALAERVPNKNFSYSDHEAVLAILSLSTYHESVAEGDCAPNRPVLENISDVKTCEAALKVESCLSSTRMAVLEEAISLCDMSLYQLNVDRIFYYSVAVVFAFILVAFLEYPAPVGFRTVCIILKFLISGVLLFSIFMATIWNFMEWNGILSGKVAMELMLKSITFNANNGKDVDTMSWQRLTVTT